MPTRSKTQHAGQKLALWLCVGLIALPLLGCSTLSVVSIETRIPETTSFVLQDDRPPKDRVSRLEPDSAYLHLGDDMIAPPPAQLFMAWLDAQVGSKLTAKRVLLLEFDVTVYEPSFDVPSTASNPATAGVKGSAAAAPLADLLLFGVLKLTAERAVFVKIAGSVEDSAFSVFLSEGFTGRLAEEDVKGTVIRALDKSAAEIRRILEDSAK